MATFNDPEILHLWQRTGRYPQIHNSIMWAAQEFLHGRRIMDLCCSFGLLGQRLLHNLTPRPEIVIGMDSDAKAVGLGKEAGIEIPITVMKLVPETAEQFYQLLKDHAINCIVARRALPELFGENREFGVQWAATLHAMGVKELLLEGRIEMARSTNALKSLSEEIALLQGYYEWSGAYLNCAKLLART